MTRIVKIVLLFCLLTGALIYINRDIFRFEYSFPYTRTFSPETDSKGNYNVSDPVTLKPGSYQLSFEGHAEKKGNGCFIIDSDDFIIYASDISEGDIKNFYPFEITETTSVRIGFSYDPASGAFEAGNIRINSGHVLYKESVLRHAALSFVTILVFIWLGMRFLIPGFPEWIRKKTGLNYAYGEKVFLYLVILTVLSSWPLFDPKRFPQGDDFFFHLSRIQGMTASLNAGYFPPRILLEWMKNYGVGCGFFYPDFFMFLPVGIHMLGFSLISSLRIFLTVCAFFSLLTMYFAGKNIGGRRELCGAAAAVIYAFASYRLVCIFYRNAVGEVQALIFYPLVIWGFVEILRGNTKKWWIFVLGFYGMLMSQMVGLAIAGVLCAVYLLCSIKKLIRNSELIKILLKSAALTLLLGAFFLMPMIEQSYRTNLQINEYMNGVPPNWAKSWKEENMTGFAHFFRLLIPWIHGTGRRDINPNPGWIILAIPLLRLGIQVFHKTSSEMKAADHFLFIGVLLLFLSTDLFPWEWFQWILIKIQYSWRLLAPATVLLSLSGGIYIETLYSDSANKKRIIILTVLAAIFSGTPLLINTSVNKNVPVEKLSLTNRIIHGAEYMPVGFNIDFVDDNKDHVLYDEKSITVTDYRRKGLGYHFSFERSGTGDPENYTLPLIYYYGYKADITGRDGKTNEIPVSAGMMGLTTVSDEGSPQGTIYVHYEKTVIQKVSEAISLITMTAVLFVMISRNRNKRTFGTRHQASKAEDLSL